MTRYIASIVSNLNFSSRDPRNYNVSFGADDTSEITGRMIQVGPVHNGSRLDRGVFETRDDALRAILAFIAVPCVIREVDNGMSTPHLVVCKHSEKMTARVIASQSAKGIFIAA